MKKYIKYLGGFAVLALCSCSDDNAPQIASGEVVKSFSIGVDSDIFSRAGVMPGDGSDILQLSYVIRDEQNEIVFATGVGDSPEPVRIGNHWSLEVTLPARQNYSVLFWADNTGVTGVVSDWRSVTAQNGSTPVSTIVAKQDSLYVRRNNGWTGIADDAMAKYFTFSSEDIIGDVILTRPHCQVLIGATSEKVMDKVMLSSFGFIDNQETLLTNGTILFDVDGGIATAPLNSCVACSMASQADYGNYDFPYQKEGLDEFYLIGGGYFSPVSLTTDGLHSEALTINYTTNTGDEIKTINIDLDKLPAPLVPNSRLVVVLYPHNEVSPLSTGASSRTASDESNNIVIPVAI